MEKDICMEKDIAKNQKGEEGVFPTKKSKLY